MDNSAIDAPPQGHAAAQKVTFVFILASMCTRELMS